MTELLNMRPLYKNCLNSHISPYQVKYSKNMFIAQTLIKYGIPTNHGRSLMKLSSGGHQFEILQKYVGVYKVGLLITSVSITLILLSFPIYSRLVPVLRNSKVILKIV